MSAHNRSNAANGGMSASAPASSRCTPASQAPPAGAAAVAVGAAEPGEPRNSTLMNGWMSAIHSVEVSEYTTMHAIAHVSRRR